MSLKWKSRKNRFKRWFKDGFAKEGSKKEYIQEEAFSSRKSMEILAFLIHVSYPWSGFEPDRLRIDLLFHLQQCQLRSQ